VSVTERPAAADALVLARRKFLSPERVDMSALADELGVNRVTVYRWLGSRDRLLVEIVWSLADELLARLQRDTKSRGAERVIGVVGGFVDAVITNPGMQRWLAEEGEHAMRLLTRHDTGFQPRLIGAVEDLLRCEADAGALAVPVDLHELAFVIVRLIESYTYLGLITGEPAGEGRAEPILRMLLR
jgi:AcrR family transcriptional regulator